MIYEWVHVPRALWLKFIMKLKFKFKKLRFLIRQLYTYWLIQLHVTHKALLWWNHCGLVMPYGDINLGQHCLKWLVAWQHQAIACPSVDLSSVGSSGINLRAILQEIHRPSNTKISLKIKYIEFHSNLLGINKLKLHSIEHCSSYGNRSGVLFLT